MRVLPNRLILWYRRKGRVAILEVWAAVVVPLAWGLLTWSAFLWNTRAWAASIGLLLMLYIALKWYATYVASKNAARRDR